MDAGVRISIIAAVAENGVIGRNGDIPWRLKSDLQRFKRLTYGKTVIVGRKTHESILRRLGHPLEGRRTIVVTRNSSYASECEVAHSFEEALERARNVGEVFVIGGAELFAEALVIGDQLYLTEVHVAPEGDASFPRWAKVLWREVSKEEIPQDGENEYATTFVIYERKVLTLPPESLSMYLPHARHADQRAVMEELARKDLCNFCPQNRSEGEIRGPIWRGRHWVLVPNRWPYRFTTLHLLAIPERHVVFPNEFTSEEWGELRELLDWAIREHKLEAGSLGMRFGTMHLTGATVEHLHVHLIVADPDATKPGYERVRFPMGPKPQ
ncbi:dihydrofolate reductase [Candidatus Parcubacteria bacterium]|nr:dihydrofolate reductase [Candidatus Parcubacteria bacterium]